MQKTFFKAPSHWKMAEAEQYAISKGYETKWIDGKLHVEEVYEECEFFIDESLVKHRGFRLEMITWNGWEVPAFTKDVAANIATEFNNVEGNNVFTWDGENLVFNDEDADEPTVIAPQVITCNGKQHTVYSWAYLGWIWEKVA